MPVSNSITIALTAPALVVLSSCGGDGSSAPTPTPTPVATTPGSGSGGSTTTDPPATTNVPPAPFGLRASAAFAMLGWQHVSHEGLPAIYAQAADKASIEWSAPDATYRIALTDLGSGKLVYSFPPSGNNTSAFSIVQADGSIARAYVTLQPQYGYAGDLQWQSADGVAPFVQGRAIFGIPVPAGALPTSGIARFVTDPLPQTALTVDFATRKVTGALTTWYRGPFDEGALEIGTVESADLQPDGTFVAVLTIPGAPRAGELRGRLFGALADQLGVYWNGPVRLGDGSWVEWRMVRVYDACTNCSP